MWLVVDSVTDLAIEMRTVVQPVVSHARCAQVDCRSLIMGLELEGTTEFKSSCCCSSLTCVSWLGELMGIDLVVVVLTEQDILLEK